jgi:hypothetical protein
MRTSREEWRKPVERWKDSGLTAQQYATELGIKASTLQYWKHRLGKPELPLGRKSGRAAQAHALATAARCSPQLESASQQPASLQGCGITGGSARGRRQSGVRVAQRARRCASLL